ncbi:MAG: AAA family ATPase [Phycisphaerales bacterium]
MIKKIRITGFKSLHDVTVELDPVTVLVGRSGTGKSAFVQAIRFLRNYLLSPHEAPKIDGGWQRLLTAGVGRLDSSFEVIFSVGAESEDYTYLLRFGKLPPGMFSSEIPVSPVVERLSLGEQVLFERLREQAGSWKWKWVTAPAMVSPPDPQMHLAIDQLSALEKVVYAYTALTSGVGYYNFPTSIWGSLQSDIPAPQRSINHYLAGLKDDASNYLDLMRMIARDLQKPQVRKAIFASLKQVNASVISVELNSMTQMNDAIVAHTVGDKALDLSLSQESDGFRRFYAHLLALYQLPPKLVNIFEEPENAIYPGALELLADEFKMAPKSDRGQVILTTHSPGLLGHFDVESIRVVDMKDGQTIIGRVSPEQREGIRDSLLTTGELLTVDPARVDTPSTSDAEKARA